MKNREIKTQFKQFKKWIRQIQSAMCKCRTRGEICLIHREGPKCIVCGESAVGGQGDQFGAKVSYCRKHWPKPAPEPTTEHKRKKMKTYLEVERELFPSKGRTKEKIAE